MAEVNELQQPGSRLVTSDDAPAVGEAQPSLTAGASSESGRAERSAEDAASRPAELERLSADLEEKERQLKRALADFDNYRRRMERDFAALAQAGKKEVILGLLEVADNFDRALAAPRESMTVESLLNGMEAVRGQLMRLLEKHGTLPYESVGQPADPQLHEVMSMVAAPGQAAGTVVTEVRKGYKLGDELLRPAQVLAARDEPEAAPQA